jgi:superfamily II DNA helicase RecQ
MRELGLYMRQIRTQTVWLTATLPPDLGLEFVERNMLVRSQLFRESTNRPNIRYIIYRYTGPGEWSNQRDKILVTKISFLEPP